MTHDSSKIISRESFLGIRSTIVKIVCFHEIRLLEAWENYWYTKSVFELEGNILDGFQRATACSKGLCKGYKICHMKFSVWIQITSQRGAKDFCNILKKLMHFAIFHSERPDTACWKGISL